MRKKCAYLFCTLFNNFVFVACTSIWLDRKTEREKTAKTKTKKQGYARRNTLRLSSCRGDIKACYNFQIMQSCAKRGRGTWTHCGMFSAGNDGSQVKKNKSVWERVGEGESALDRGRAWHEQCTHALTRWQGCMWHLRDLATTHHKYEISTLHINKCKLNFEIIV